MVRHMPKLIALIILLTFGSVIAGVLLSPFVHPAVIAGLLIVVCSLLVFRHRRSGAE
jgi:predicted PurR-regulated permease PerM